jgi:hypothetical protein
MATTTSKRVIRVEVVEGRPRDPLASLEAAQGAKRDEHAAAVATARKELAPLVEESRRLLGEVAKLRDAHGRTLGRILAVDWRRLQLAYGLPEGSVRRLERLVQAVLDGLASTESNLVEVRKRIDALTPADLVPAIFPPTSVAPGGMYPAGPHNLRVDMALYRAFVTSVPDTVAEVEYLVRELESRVAEREPRAVRTIEVDREPEPEEPTVPGRAEMEFDVFARQ